LRSYWNPSITAELSMTELANTPVIYRHSVTLRVLHWSNALCLFVLLLSGLQIFNAHPTLYWGQTSNPDHAVLQIFAVRVPDGPIVGVTDIFGQPFITTGFLGRSTGTDGRDENRAFPQWSTLPSDRGLAMGRRWHFFFAWWLVLNGILYVGYALASRHFSRDLLPTGSDWRGIGRSIVDHMRFRHATGADAAHYNVLQKLSYLAVMFVMLPLMVLFGLAMSPQMDTVLHWVLDLVGGRQSARTLHFVLAFLLVAFFLVHIFQVIATGPINNLRSIITGRFRIPPARAVDRSASPGPPT
jgi:thiosulfate reductase cytochrome b subunit